MSTRKTIIPCAIIMAVVVILGLSVVALAHQSPEAKAERDQNERARLVSEQQAFLHHINNEETQKKMEALKSWTKDSTSIVSSALQGSLSAVEVAKDDIEEVKEEETTQEAETYNWEDLSQYYYEQDASDEQVYYNNSGEYSPSDLRTLGVVYDDNYRYTWYSENVLPGGGLDIPGRWSDGDFVRDENGYLCVASSDLAQGTVVSTPWGDAKVYDSGCASGTIDMYVSW